MIGWCIAEGYMMGRMTGIIPEGACKTGIMAEKGMAIAAGDCCLGLGEPEADPQLELEQVRGWEWGCVLALM